MDEAARKAAAEEAMKKRAAQASAAGKRGKGPDLSAAKKAAAQRDKKGKSKPDAYDL